MFRSLKLASYPQIIQTEGSYSFLLCGMIVACIGFILFIGLLLFHRMHRNYLAGKASIRILVHCLEIRNRQCAEGCVAFISDYPPLQISSQQEHQGSQKWWRSQQQNRMGQSKQNKKRTKKAAEKVVCKTAVREEVLQQSSKTVILPVCFFVLMTWYLQSS